MPGPLHGGAWRCLAPERRFTSNPNHPFAPVPQPNKGDTLPVLAAEVHAEGAAVLEKHAAGVAVGPIERFDFYERARSCFAVVQCSGERRPYGNFVLTKGVVGPDGNDLKP